MDAKAVAKLVKDANRSEVARKTGIHLSHISRVLSGKRRASSQNLADIAIVLGCTMDELHMCLMKLRTQVTRQSAA
jgi:transcriptional regulator with XRE-family HTH domain